MFWTNIAYAMGGAGAPPPGGEASLWGSLVPIVAMFAIFYFLLIRPQQKRAKEHKNMISTLKRGDEVISAGGLYGRVTDTGDDYIMVDLGSTTVKMSRSAISVVKSGKAPVEKKNKKDDGKDTDASE